MGFEGEFRGSGEITSTDDWLERKRISDGAEGLWRIHNKIYDFTLWSRIHPGGHFWLDATRGTDITEAFESHHFSKTAEETLEKYYKREASTPPTSSYTFENNGFFKEFKRELREEKWMRGRKPSWKSVVLNDSLAVAVFVTGLFGARDGNFWALICGILLGLLATYSHDFLHMKYCWRVNYFNLSLMSSREWRIRHVLSHHQYRNTNLDLELSSWQPFFRFFSVGSDSSWRKWIISFFVFATTAHMQFFKRFFDVFLSRKLGFHPEELVAFTLPLFLFLFGGTSLWNVFIMWNLIILTGSFFFCLLNLRHNTHNFRLNDKNPKKKLIDFGIMQISQTESHPSENESIFSSLNSFRKNVLHYLCPGIDCDQLSKVMVAFDNTCKDFQVSYGNSGRILEELLKDPPHGHLFFS